MRPLQYQPILSQPSNASITTTPIDLRQIVCFSLQAAASNGACAGTFQFQVSNTPCTQKFSDYAAANLPVWTNLGSPLTFAQASTASSQIIAKQDSSYVALRIIFTDTSSGSNTSTITANFAALGM